MHKISFHSLFAIFFCVGEKRQKMHCKRRGEQQHTTFNYLRLLTTWNEEKSLSVFFFHLIYHEEERNVYDFAVFELMSSRKKVSFPFCRRQNHLHYFRSTWFTLHKFNFTIFFELWLCGHRHHHSTLFDPFFSFFFYLLSDFSHFYCVSCVS